MIQRVPRESSSSPEAFVAKSPTSFDEVITQPSSLDNKNQHPRCNNKNPRNNCGKKNQKIFAG
jgi:hypothetical protein